MEEALTNAILQISNEYTEKSEKCMGKLLFDIVDKIDYNILSEIDYKKLDDYSNIWLKKFGFTMLYIEKIFIFGYALCTLENKSCEKGCETLF